MGTEHRVDGTECCCNVVEVEGAVTGMILLCFDRANVDGRVADKGECPFDRHRVGGTSRADGGAAQLQLRQCCVEDDVVLLSVFGTRDDLSVFCSRLVLAYQLTEYS